MGWYWGREKGEGVRPGLKGSPGGEARFTLFSLAAVYGLLAVRIFLAFAVRPDDSPRNDFFLYAGSWVVALTAGTLGGWIAARARERRSPRLDLSAHLFVNTALLVIAFSVEATGVATGVALCGGFLAAQAALAFVVSRGSETRPSWARRLPPLPVASFLLFAMWVLSKSHEIFITPTKWKALRFALMGFLAWALPWSLRGAGTAPNPSAGTRDAERTKNRRWLIDGIVFTVLAVLLIDPNFPVDVNHENYYLGPLADLRAGKSMLVDINAQYGVLVFYFLHLVFKLLPIGYVSLCLVVTLLILLQDFLFYLIAARLFGRRLFTFLTVGVLLLLNHYATLGHAQSFPSTGPLRFGFIYLLLASILFRNDRPKWKAAGWAWESLLMAAAAFWSLEVCAYVVPAYGALILYEAFARREGIRAAGREIAARSALWLGFAALLGGALYLGTHLRSGQWPDWGRYLSYVFMYQNGFGLITIEPSGVWWYPMALMVLSLTAIAALTLRRDAPSMTSTHLNAIFLLTVYGISQFLYYLARAHPNNLFHVSMPAVLLTAYWMFVLRTRVASAIPDLVRKGTLIGGMVAIVVTLPEVFPSTVDKWKEQFMRPPEAIRRVVRAFRDEPRDERFALEAARLMDRYSPGGRRVPYFLGPRGIEVSLYAGKVKTHPFNDLDQAGFCPPVLRRIMRFDPGLRAGDHVFIAEEYVANPAGRPGGRIQLGDHTPLGGSDGIGSLEQRANFYRALEISLLENIDKKFPIVEVERSGGIVVGRLQPGR